MTILDENNLKALIRVNGEGNFGPRNTAAITCAALWGLTASELSLITVGDVLKQNGKLKREWELPAHIAFNGYPRKLYSEHPKLIETMYEYLDWRVKKGYGVTNLGIYRSLDKEAPLMVNNQGKPFNFTASGNGDRKRLQPSGINSLFRRMLARTNNKATYKSFRQSLMIHLRRDSGLPIKDIMAVTGIRDYESVRKIVSLDPEPITDAVKGLYSRL